MAAMIDRLPVRSICPERKMQILTMREIPYQNASERSAALLMSHFKKLRRPVQRTLPEIIFVTFSCHTS